MSIHKSLVVSGKLKRHRNVLKRSERLERLLADGKSIDEISVFGLQKLRNIMPKVKAKPKKETAEAAAGATPGIAATAAPAGAAGAKPAIATKTPSAGTKTTAESKPAVPLGKVKTDKK
ncbi:MAG: small basic protein [Planctomycetota bacterium]|nr:small basic protein [Planctomycetota bacterium]MDI6788453.1 small basic protein [Planctomycetota bacterium]